MPFDGTDHQPRRLPEKRVTSGDNMVSIMIVLVGVGLLVTPISLGALVDIVRYLRGG